MLLSKPENRFLSEGTSESAIEQFLTAYNALRDQLTAAGYDLESVTTQVEYVVNPLAAGDGGTSRGTGRPSRSATGTAGNRTDLATPPRRPRCHEHSCTTWRRHGTSGTCR